MQSKIFKASAVFIFGLLFGYSVAFFFSRYKPIEEMRISLRELAQIDSSLYGNRYLHIIRKEENLFDFCFESTKDEVAKVTLCSIDLLKQDPVQLEKGSSFLRIAGGDGFEEDALTSAALIPNNLEKGIWELVLYTGGLEKKLYYHGYFSFPKVIHFKNFWRFDAINALSGK